MKKIKINRILMTFNYCRAGDLIKITRRILDSLKDNAQFSNPTPVLAEIETALEEFSAALSAAGSGDREKIAIKDVKQATLMQMLTELAYYITQICKGDKAMLLSSGFDINGETNKAQKAPPKLNADLGLPGQVTTSVTKVSKARAYVHQYTPDPLTPQSVWISETTAKAEHTFTGLETASRVWFRIIILDRYGQQVIWEPISRIIQ